MLKRFALFAALIMLIPAIGLSQGAGQETEDQQLIRGIEVTTEDGQLVAKVPPDIGETLAGIQKGIDQLNNYVEFDADDNLGDPRLDEYFFPVLETGSAGGSEIESLRDYLGRGELPVLKAFVYQEGDGGKIVREMLDATIKTELEDVRIEALQLEFEAVMPPTADPNDYDPLAFAEWQYFFEQVELWQRYISDELFGEDLWQESTYEPRVAEDEFTELVDSHQRQSNQLAFLDAERVRSVLRRVESRKVEREKYRAWLASRQSEIDEFADSFKKQLEGNLIIIDGQKFMVTPEAQDRYPAYTIPVVTNVLTPHDLLNEDGTVRKYRLSRDRSKFGGLPDR